MTSPRVRLVPLKVNCRKCGLEIPVELGELPAEPAQAREVLAQIEEMAARAHVCTCTCAFDDRGKMVGRDVVCPVHSQFPASERPTDPEGPGL